MSEAWSANLAVQLSTLLENKGRQYRLFFLKADYTQWKHCIQDLGPVESPEFEANLIQQIFNFDSEVEYYVHLEFLISSYIINHYILIFHFQNHFLSANNGIGMKY